MPRTFALALCAALALGAPALADPSPDHPGEEMVKPYVQSDANADTKPMQGQGVFLAFHGKEGVARIADTVVDKGSKDPRIAEIFKGQDLVRLKRTLAEQICYVLGGPCAYTGRDMRSAHADLGVQDADFNALVEDLQWAMNKEGVPFRAQNKLLAKLAPMHRDIVQK